MALHALVLRAGRTRSGWVSPHYTREVPRDPRKRVARDLLTLIAPPVLGCGRGVIDPVESRPPRTLIRGATDELRQDGDPRPPGPRADHPPVEPLRVLRPAGVRGRPAVALRGGPVGAVVVQRAAVAVHRGDEGRPGRVRPAAVVPGGREPGVGAGRPGDRPRLHQPRLRAQRQAERGGDP